MVKEWPRPSYESNGGEPFLFYVVYGSVDLESPLSRSTYRSDGIPDGLEIMHYGSERHAKVVSGFREDYVWEQFLKRDAACAAKVATAKECIVFRGNPADSTNLNYLRDTVGLLTHFLANGGLSIYDPQMFHWWTPESWRERIFLPDGPVPHHHVVILTSSQDDPDLTWFHTRGMRKFGRPDLSIRDVPTSHRFPVIDLCSRFIEHQAFGAVIPEGQLIRIPSLPEGMTCHHAGDVDDPDFNNVHVEMIWPNEAS